MKIKSCAIRKIFPVMSLILVIMIIINQYWTKEVFSKEVIKNSKNKVLIVVLDRLSVSDYTNKSLKNIRYIADSGLFGIMNTNTRGNAVVQNTFISLGAGWKALGDELCANVFNADEFVGGRKAKDIYKESLGLACKNYNIIFPYIKSLKADNVSSTETYRIGALGDEIHKSKLKTCVIGNSDTINNLKYLNSKERFFEPQRYFAQFLLDSKGIIDYGDISKDVLTKDLMYPYGIKTDSKKLIAKFKEFYKRSDVVELQLGDIQRLEDTKNIISAQKYNAVRDQILLDQDKIIGRLIKLIDNRTQVILITPTPLTARLYGGEWMTPVAIWTKGGANGVISSGTTHRNGIIANYDIAATILEHLGLKRQAWFSGQPIEKAAVKISSNSKIDFIQKLNTRIIFTYKERLPLLFGFGFYIIFCLIFGVLNIYFKGNNIKKHKLLKIGDYMLVSVVFIPVSIFLLPLFKDLFLVKSFNVYLFMCFIYSAVLVAVMTIGTKLITKNPMDCFIIGGFLSTLIILIDTFTGFKLIQNCALGSDVQIGVRYYGLGNEVMGILLGSSIISATVLLDRVKNNKSKIKMLIILYFLIVLTVLVYPGLGTKAGGAITAFAAFAVVIFKLYNIDIRFKQVCFIILGVLGLLAVLAMIDMSNSAQIQSHIGRSATLIGKNGIGEAVKIITRKIAMNIKLINYYKIGLVLSIILITSLIGLLVMCKMKAKTLLKIFKGNHYAYIGFIGMILGSLLAFFFNDSGIVAAGTASIYPLSMFMYLISKTKINFKFKGVISCLVRKKFKKFYQQL